MRDRTRSSSLSSQHQHSRRLISARCHSDHSRVVNVVVEASEEATAVPGKEEEMISNDDNILSFSILWFHR